MIKASDKNDCKNTQTSVLIFLACDLGIRTQRL